MRQVQIYLKGLDSRGEIKDFRLDLYKDESIEITSSIKQAKDIGTIYSDYSQSFTLPASDTNNKVFKHFYKFDISTGYFDARLRQDAFIEINSLPYRRGKMFLSSVNMKNNKPMFYKVVFYGNVATLKDIFSDHLLSSLDLTDFEHDFSHSEVKSIFKDGKTVNGDTEALIYPLITSKKRLFYDDTIGNTDDANFDGNLYIPSTGNDIDRYHKRGISEYDLKPAIKVYQLIKAIEAKYDLVLIPDDTSGTKDFFSKHNEAFANLYMWLSSKAGNIYGEEGEEDYAFKKVADGFRRFESDSTEDYGFFYVSGDDDEIINIASVFDHLDEVSATLFYLSVPDDNKFRIRVMPSSGEENIEYRIKLIDIDTGNVQTASGSGRTRYEFPFPILAAGDDPKRYKIEFSSKTAMTGTRVRPEIFQDQKFPFSDDKEIFRSNAFDTSASKVFLNEQIPEIKIIDFINGLFKMFNLVAYIIDDESDPEFGKSTTQRIGTPNVVKIMTYDDYYADAVNNTTSGTIDITKYIDVSEHDVDTILPFREINFEYEETDIILMEQHLKLSNGKIFGNANNSIETEFGKFFHDEVYDIKVPFSHFKYERLLGTDIQWGYAAGGDFRATAANYSDEDDIIPPKGNYDSKDVKPLLFYGIKTTITDTPINFNDTIDDVEAVTTYFRPSNGNEDSSVSDNEVEDDSLLATYYLNFGIDLDEWSGAVALNSLYGLFYRNYIRMILGQKKRLHKFKAFLPPSFIVNYKLNDQLKIQDTIYRVNLLEINLTTGKSNLELINLEDTEII